MKKSDLPQEENSAHSLDAESDDKISHASELSAAQQLNQNKKAATTQKLVENEPYLGPAWAVAMLILYLLKEAFPAEEYSPLWWFQMYIVVLVVAITLFALIKRHQFYKTEDQDNHDE